MTDAFASLKRAPDQKRREVVMMLREELELKRNGALERAQLTTADLNDVWKLR